MFPLLIKAWLTLALVFPLGALAQDPSGTFDPPTTPPDTGGETIPPPEAPISPPPSTTPAPTPSPEPVVVTSPTVTPPSTTPQENPSPQTSPPSEPNQGGSGGSSGVKEVLPLATTSTSLILGKIQNVIVEQLRGAGELLASIDKQELEDTTRQVAPFTKPVGLGSGLAAILVPLVESRSLYDIYLMFARLFSAILGFFGLRKRGEPWGTVYDSVTKRPIDPAVVTAMGALDYVRHGEAITDLDGRYAFLLPDGRYKISAHKSDYTFPSKLMQGRPSDELYTNLYYGEEIEAKSGELIVRDIPLDPVGFNWNEFIKSKRNLFKIHERRQRIVHSLLSLFYTAGFLASLVSAAVLQTRTEVFFLIVYVVIFWLSRLAKTRYQAVTIIDERVGEPVSFAIVRVFFVKSRQEVEHVVADAEGRFHLLISPGEYYISIQARRPNAVYETIFTSGPLKLTKGVLGIKTIAVTSRGVVLR